MENTSLEAAGPVRVRFAPSPTGYLHIGGARTALFNFLFARRHGGTLVLRIEDTDRERSTPEAVQAIFDGLRFLGIEWDEGPEKGGAHGPYFQSERAALYAAFVERLTERGHAYFCFCTRERLEALAAEQQARKERRHYDRRCLGLSSTEVRRRREAGEPAVVRFQVPEGKTTFQDLIRGEVSFEHSEVEDFVIRRADGTCVYNLAVVADDHGMEITHVIRGEDHLSNTPKQILLFQALELAEPRYAHIPLILAPGGGKLSKRHGAVAVTEYREKGYLPEAMVNFLARLGWSYDDRQEIFTLYELIAKFSLKGVSKAGAVYDLAKLNHLGAHYLRRRPLEEVLELSLPHLVRAGFASTEEAAPGAKERGRLLKMVELAQPRMEYLAQVVEQVRFYFEEPRELEAAAAKILVKRQAMEPVVQRYAEALAERFGGLEGKLSEWGPEDHAFLEEHARAFVAAEGVSMGDLAQPLRAILTGRSATPGLFEVMAILGRERTLARLRRAGEWFAKAREMPG
jgi:glutamyl-tRNA synthetase